MWWLDWYAESLTWWFPPTRHIVYFVDFEKRRLIRTEVA
jgi:hypothetical protein